MAEFHRVRVFCTAVLAMDAHGHAIAALALTDSPADFDGSEQDARPALGVGGCVVQHLIEDGLGRILENPVAGPAAVASGCAEHVGHLGQIFA